MAKEKEETVAKDDNKKKKIVIIAVIVLVLLLAGLLVFFLLKNRKVTIKFDSDGGTAVEKQVIKKGGTITIPESTKEGFTLEGWFIEEEKVTSTKTFDKNTTLKARWSIIEAKSYTITFDSKGGTEVSPLKVECDKEVTLPIAPTKEGYTFVSWVDKNETPILDGALLSCENVTLYANWEKEDAGKKYYTITFDSNGGSNVNAVKVECDTKVKLPATKPTKTGYKFVSWADKNGKVILDGAFLSCEDVTLYANWEKAASTKTSYKVTFDSRGGSAVSPITVDCSKTLTLPANPKRSGYDFVVWTDKSGKAILNGAKLSCEDITLYADWKEITPETPEKQYKCPSGYTLSDDKKTCTMTAESYYECPSGMTWSAKRGACYVWAGNPTSTTCKSGAYYIKRDNADDICCGEEITRLTGNVSGCQNEGGTMYNNHCCKKPEVATSSNTNHTCAGTTVYLTATDLGGTQNSGCYKLDQRTLKCPEGFIMNHTYGKCMKTTTPTYE